MVHDDVCAQFKEMFKEKEIVTEQMHKGDDIAIFTTSWIASVILNIGMRNAGQLGQDSKLIVGNGEFEFLRRMFCQDGKIRGYLHRTMPNAVGTDY